MHGYLKKVVFKNEYMSNCLREKIIGSIVCLLFCGLVFPFCKKPSNSNSSSSNMSIPVVLGAHDGNVSYMIFVPSFADADGDGVGDLKGVLDKLPELDSLGIGAIWLSPIHPTASYHGYDVKDYKAINPLFGTIATFDQLIAEAHKRNIKIYVDLVLGHSSKYHPWFLSAGKDNPSDFRDFYTWSATGASSWALFDGVCAYTEKYYFNVFSDWMPSLNLSNTALMDSVKSITNFWLVDHKVDGFRLDAVKHYYGGFDGDATKTIPKLKEITNIAYAQKPAVYFVSEMLDEVDRNYTYLQGTPRVFNFSFWWRLSDYLNNQHSGYDFWIKYFSIYSTYNATSNKIIQGGLFKDVLKLSNHDEDRTMYTLNNSVAKAKAAAAVLLGLPGESYIYYGEELGMKGNKSSGDEGVREPFLWNILSNDKYRVKKVNGKTPIFNTDAITQPLALQKKNKESMYNLYQQLIALRNQYPVLQKDGNAKLISKDGSNATIDARILAFSRSDGTTTISYYINFSESQLILSLPNRSPLLLVNSAVYQSGSLQLPAYGIAIFKNK